MVQAMEGAMDGTSYGSRSSRTNVQAMDQGAVEGDIDDASDGRSDSLLVQAMNHEAVDGTSDGSGSCRSKHRCNWKEAHDDDRMMI